ncbi:hypothetical protein [Haloferula sp. BvORR071]|uniref:hypothetical protein n=1 Tax=Haloferula sp. BvORR071 TaxID=1396141 RepID=UPI0005554EEF|nr:hypothetical protein [Haloferula sp. BvORR071]
MSDVFRNEQDWRPITFEGVVLPPSLMGISILEAVLDIEEEELAAWLWRLPICKGLRKSAPAERCARCAEQTLNLMLEHREQVTAGITERLALQGLDPEATYREWAAALVRIMELSKKVRGHRHCHWSAPAHASDHYAGAESAKLLLGRIDLLIRKVDDSRGKKGP